MSAEAPKAMTADERIEAANERRARRASEEAEARKEQFATDLEAIEEIEAKKGVKLHYSDEVRNYVPGLPVVVAVRAPDRTEYKRLLQRISRTQGNADAKVAALVELGEVCWEYPAEKDTRKGMIDANPALAIIVGTFANQLAEVELKEEGKK